MENSYNIYIQSNDKNHNNKETIFKMNDNKIEKIEHFNDQNIRHPSISEIALIQKAKINMEHPISYNKNDPYPLNNEYGLLILKEFNNPLFMYSNLKKLRISANFCH